MKYVEITKAKDIKVANDLDMPKIKEGEALLKLLYAGICGSDLGSYRGTMAYTVYPCIPGHEFSAEISEIGENSLGLKKGDIVTANPYFNCGDCYSCKRGLVNCCTTNKTMGVQREGCFKEYITMPIERIYKSETIDAKTLALIEPFAIAYHGVKKACIKKGEKVLIIGAGTIGILSAISAKIFGAEVYVADISKDKLEYAKNFNIDGVILNSDTFENEINKITNGNLFDVVIEAVGLPSTFQNAIDSATFGGRVIVIGVGKQNLDFNFTLIQKKELHIHGSRNAIKSDFLELIDIVKNGDVKLDKIITSIYSLDEAKKAFEDFDKGQQSQLKVMIKF